MTGLVAWISGVAFAVWILINAYQTGNAEATYAALTGLGLAILKAPWHRKEEESK